MFNEKLLAICAGSSMLSILMLANIGNAQVAKKKDVVTGKKTVSPGTSAKRKAKFVFFAGKPFLFDTTGKVSPKEIQPEDIQGSNFQRNAVFKGAGSQMSYSTRASNNELRIDLHTSLDDSLVNTSTPEYSREEYFNVYNAPYILLHSEQKIKITITFDLTSDSTATLISKGEEGESFLSDGSNGILIVRSNAEISKDSSDKLYSQKTGPVTFKKTITGFAVREDQENLQSDSYGVIRDSFENFDSDNGRPYEYCVSLQSFANRFFRNHQEIKTDPPSEETFWSPTPAVIRHRKRPEVGMKLESKGHITIKVDEVYPTLDADFDLASEASNGSFAVPMRVAYGNHSSFWSAGPYGGGHKILSIHSLGKSKYSAKQAMNILKRNIERVFPLGARGINGHVIKKGAQFHVTRYQPLPSKVFVPQDPTDYQFVFQAVANPHKVPTEHIFQGTQIFGIFRDSSGELWLFQQGRGNDKEWKIQAGTNYLLARPLWNSMADNLRNLMIQSDAYGQIG